VRCSAAAAVSTGTNGWLEVRSCAASPPSMVAFAQQRRRMAWVAHDPDQPNATPSGRVACDMIAGPHCRGAGSTLSCSPACRRLECDRASGPVSPSTASRPAGRGGCVGCRGICRSKGGPRASVACIRDIERRYGTTDGILISPYESRLIATAVRVSPPQPGLKALTGIPRGAPC
jgi:hypothetical protein